MYEEINKEWFFRKYLYGYEEVESYWESYKNIIHYLDNVDNIPDEYDEIPDWILSEISWLIIDIIGREVFGDEQYDKVVDHVTESSYDSCDWSGCSFERNNAIHADIYAFVDYICQVASDNKIDLTPEEYDPHEIIHLLNYETDFKFV